MSIWARIQRLDGDALEKVGLVYAENFPIDVRHALADWIEQQPWNDVDTDNPKQERWAAQFASNLIKEVELKAATGDNILMRLKLREAANDFKQKYSNNPRQLVRVIKDCLQAEMTIIQQAENANFCNGLNSYMDTTSEPGQEIKKTLDKLRQKAQGSEDSVYRMQQEQENFVIHYQEYARRQAQFHQGLSSNPETAARLQQEMQQLNQAIQGEATALVRLRSDIVEKQQTIFEELTELQKRILDTELIQWKRRQQMAGNGALFENNLDEIQGWCEGLADIIWQNRKLIKNFESLCSHVKLDESGDIMTTISNLKAQITSLFTNLVASALVIETQPSQVIKTATKFNATVRLLLGSKLGLASAPPQVKVTIISEAQTNALLKNHNKGYEGDIWLNTPTCGQILNSIGTMEHHEASRKLSINFKNLQLRKIKRSEKKGTELVMDEKFSIFFLAKFNIGCGELYFHVWTLSLPVVVIVHGNQEHQAWATITWDNASAEYGRIPFQVPEKIPWSKMAEVLKTKFRAATGRELMPENLQFLKGKVFGSTQYDNDNASYITWSQFCKEPLPERNFTFWEWFYTVMKTTRDHLRNLWTDGLILGFISRQQAEEMLFVKSNGTFLLRFSDSELGGVTIAWVAHQREGTEVLMIQPFTSRDFTIRGLADRIKDLNNLVYLYPEIPKDNAFKKYYTLETEKQPHPPNGYLPRRLVTQIIGEANNGGSGHAFDSFPGTPQSQSSSDMSGSGHGFDSTPETSQSQSSPPTGHGFDNALLTFQSQSQSDMSTGNNYPEMDDMISEYLPGIDDPEDLLDINLNNVVFNFSQSFT